MCLKFQLKRRLWNLKFFCRIVGITLATLLTQTESQHMLNSAKCQWNTELSTKIIALLPDYLLIYCSVKPFNWPEPGNERLWRQWHWPLSMLQDQSSLSLDETLQSLTNSHSFSQAKLKLSRLIKTIFYPLRLCFCLSVGEFDWSAVVCLTLSQATDWMCRHNAAAAVVPTFQGAERPLSSLCSLRSDCDKWSWTEIGESRACRSRGA